MVRTMSIPKHRLTTRNYQQRGFALLETLIAIVVLMIGLLAVLATFALAVSNTASVQNDAIARQKAAEALIVQRAEQLADDGQVGGRRQRGAPRVGGEARGQAVGQRGQDRDAERLRGLGGDALGEDRVG